MKRIWPGLFLFLGVALAAHAVTLHLIPVQIMSVVRDRLATAGLPENTWRLAPKVSPQNQTVVRPAPDLAYSICLVDLSEGPVRIEGAAWERYASLSVFDRRTDNLFVTSLDSREPGPRGVILHAADAPAPGGQAQLDLPSLEVEGNEALALIRRLAPTQALYDQVAELSRADRCDVLPGE